MSHPSSIDSVDDTAIIPPLWRNADYRMIVSAGIVSATGSKISQIALPLLALGLSDLPLWAGLLGAAQMLPYVLFSLLAGVWVDRVNRKRLLVICDLVRGVLLLSVPLVYAAGALSIAHMLVVVFASGVCAVLFEVADLAALPHVVHPTQVAQARSLSEGIEATATVLGPSLGGAIVSLGRSTVAGAVLAYAVDGASYLVSGLALLRVQRPLQASQLAAHEPLRAALANGMRFVWRHPTLRMLMLLTSAVNFLQAPTSLCVILLAQRRLGLAPSQIGVVFGVAGVAALAGAVFALRWYRPERLSLIVVASLAVWTLSALMLAFAPHVLWLAAGLALAQLVWPIYGVAVVSYRLAETPDALQGRVISAFRTVSYGAEPLGLAMGGAALNLVAPSTLLTIIGGGLLVCAVLVCVRGRYVLAHT